MNKILFSFIALFLAGNYANAQQTNWCGSAAANRKIFDENPRLKQDYEALFLDGMTKSDDTTIFTIPVVFHILHEYGAENISDAQVFDQMAILNRDYRAINTDTADVINPFKGIIGDAKIQFKLANYDPLGNCTNGIDRIYTHLTNGASDLSKVQQWFRPHYLNVWVTKTIGSAGTAGYAYYPTATNGTAFTIDGIIILHDYVGSIGTGSPYASRALTHEIGHWLSLAHPWGSSNEPGEPLNCEIDDLVQDTPLCKGVTDCIPIDPNTCNDMLDPNNYSQYDYDVIDNIQNFMDYSYCSVMFTKQQVAKMREALQGTDGHRNELITPSTHAATGIDLETPVTCIPEAEFFTPNRNPCVGTPVTFGDYSTKGIVTSRLWTFQDATPSTSTAANPTVVFNSQGAKSVTLTVTNDAGSNTLTIPGYVAVNNNWGDYTGPYSNDLNSAQSHPDWFRVENLENNEASFQYRTSGGKGNSGCFKLNNYKDISAALPFTDESYYYDRLEGVMDHLITPSFDLRFTTGAVFSFDYSYASNANTVEQITEFIQVYKSNDCGVTWNPLTGNQGKVAGAELVSSGGFAANSDFAPSNDGQWKTKNISFSTSSADAKTRFRITFRASSKSSNLFIDNINISGNGNAGLYDFGQTHDLVIAPNPVNAGSNLNVTYTAQNEPVTFTLRNLQGQEVMSTVKNETNQVVSFNLEIDSKLPAAYYFLEVKSPSATTVKKIVVMGN